MNKPETDYQVMLNQQLAIPNRRLPAWVMSFLMHTLLFVCILLLLRTVQRGGSEIENRTGGIVLVAVDSESTEFLDEGDIEQTSSNPMSEQSPPPLAADSELPPDLPGIDASQSLITGAGDELIDALPGADSLIDGPTGGVEIGGKVTTEVFGVKGTGTRFVYVFDRSKSMEGYNARPLLAAREALLKSLDSLGENQQFQIVFYNDSVSAFSRGGVKGMHYATAEIKKDAVIFVESVAGDRGTDHLNALKYAFRMSPDVIFLLTDAEGGFSASELRAASDYNRSAAIINAIEFGERQGNDRSLEKLAIESGGQYVFKNILSLKVRK